MSFNICRGTLGSLAMRKVLPATQSRVSTGEAAADNSCGAAGNCKAIDLVLRRFGTPREAANMVCDLLQKIELLHAAGTEMNPQHGQEIVRTFYDILTVLDTKSLALLAFDGIVVAATTFAAERGGVFHNRGLPRWLAILIIILSLAA